MLLNQISVFLENKRGRLAEITNILETHRIDIRALSIADTKDFGILRLIVDRPDDAAAALKNEGFTVSITKVIAICIDDEPGGLAKAMRALGGENIDVEYMYAFISREEKKAFVIIRVEDNEKAITVLENNAIELMKASDI